jgi:PAS domain S-box-containing protein
MVTANRQWHLKIIIGGRSMIQKESVIGQISPIDGSELRLESYHLKKVEELMPGDHLCCLFRTELEHKALLTDYLLAGLSRNERIFYIIDAHSAETIKGYLKEKNIDVDALIKKGQFQILTVKESYLQTGTFDPDAMIKTLTEATKKALDDGYSALRVTGEMTWVLGAKPGSERLIEYEAKLNGFFPKSKCMAICQYDMRKFEPSVLLDVVRTHPYVVNGTEIYDNFYFLDPEEFFEPNRELVLLNKWLKNLDCRKRIEVAQRESEERANQMAESSMEGLVFHSGGIIFGANSALLKMIGYGSAELIGKSPWEFYQGDRTLAHTDGQTIHGPREVIINRKDGTTFPALIQVRFSPYKGEIATTIAIRDLTERKKMEQMIKDNARSEIHSIMISALPTFIENLPETVRKTYASTFGMRFEEQMRSKFLKDMDREDASPKNRDRPQSEKVFPKYIKWLSGFIENLGASVKYQIDGPDRYLEFNNCIWGPGVKPNPLFCQISRIIVLRSFSWTGLPGQVVQTGSILNGQRTCRFEFQLIEKGGK